ncbi:intraflagellar transport 74 [Lamellibrachia satsuma]|nr:intraflagellar transport 74 [Lamellibrachia satsuma]
MISGQPDFIMSYRPPSSSGARMGTASRPQSGMRPMGTAAGRPPGTASRLATGMTQGSMTGGGIALQAVVKVGDRPITREGLTMKTGMFRGPQRQVQDKTYFLGLLRGKINELNAEIVRLRKEVDTITEDQSSYLSYEKRAESLASEIRDLQGELADYNTLVDKLNTDESINDIRMDCSEMKVQNDRESKSLDTLFEAKKEKEGLIRQCEVELQQEKSMTDTLVEHMDASMRQKYLQLKDTNEHLLRQLENGQQQLDQLNVKKEMLEEDLAVSPVKQEAVRLYEQLHELEEKRDQLLEETQSRGTPQQEREKLLKQVKEDNSEMASMEKQVKMLTDRIAGISDEIRQLDIGIEENQGERNQKYKDLKRREETMDEFLTSFDETKAQEMDKIEQLESNVVLILEHMSRNMARFTHLPTPSELESMKDDLAFKEGEMQKAQATGVGLAGETAKLHQDLQKVEQLDTKISTELDMLKKKISMMTSELETYSDLEKLRADAEMKKQKLAEDKVTLHKRHETFKKVLKELTRHYESIKAHLNENETYTQLGNLEKKWQHHEQNNFVLKEFIATKTMESDYSVIAKKVSSMIGSFNKTLQDQLLNKPSIA